MSLLSPEQLAAMQAKLEEASDNFETTDETPDQEAQSDSGDRKTADTEQTEEKPKAGKPDPVPFERFTQVNRKYREMETRAKQLEAELESVKKAQSRTEPKAERSFLDELLDLEKGGSGNETKAPTELEQRLAYLETQHATALLDQTIAGAKRDYPDLPEDFVLAALAAKLSVEDAAQVWGDLKGKFGQSGNSTVQNPPTKPSNPPAVRKAPPAPPKAPATMDEAAALLRRRLREL